MIFPKPQKMTLTGEPLFKGIPSVTVSGDYNEYAFAFLNDELPAKREGNLAIRITVTENEKTAYSEKTHRLCDEKYFLEISENALSITACAKRGLFRALCTLTKLLMQHELCAGAIEDYPLFEKRGYIEGFYGNTWAPAIRKDVLKLMARHGMNTFYYAPKDDAYHRAKWRECYPEKELDDLRELFQLSVENEIDFHYCIAPGLSMRYTSQEDFDTLIRKLKSLYDIGIRKFGLLLDDIPRQLQYDEDKERYGETLFAHIDLVNRAYDTLTALDRTVELTMCPLQYHGKGDEFFISKLGQGLYPEIRIFWTGHDICSQELTSLEAIKFIDSTRHRPLYWDNYPVNDAEMFHEMHIGPLEGRDSDLYRYARGLIANVMEYANCSKIPLLTIADYLWNPEQYDKEQSYEYALNTVLGEKATLFSYIADHLQVSCLNRHGSVFLSQTLDKALFELDHGSPFKAFAILSEYLDNAAACAEMLKDTSVPLFAELKVWSDKFDACVKILTLCFEAITSGDDETKAELFRLAEDYDRDATVLSGFCLREAVQQALEH